MFSASCRGGASWPFRSSFHGGFLEKGDHCREALPGFQAAFRGPIRGGLLLPPWASQFSLRPHRNCGGIVIAIGLIAMPSMLKYGYDKRLVAGTICSAVAWRHHPPEHPADPLRPCGRRSISLLFFSAMLPGVLMASFTSLTY